MSKAIVTKKTVGGMFKNTKASELKENTLEANLKGVNYYYGMGFFQVVFEDGRTFQVCYNTENGKINLSDLGEDWGICGEVNEDFEGDIYEETIKHAKIVGIKTYK